MEQVIFSKALKIKGRSPFIKGLALISWDLNVNGPLLLRAQPLIVSTHN